MMLKLHDSIQSFAGRRPVFSALAAGLAALWLLKKLRSLTKKQGVGEDLPWALGWKPIIGHLGLFLKYGKDCDQLGPTRIALGVKDNEGHNIFRMEALGMQIVIVNDVEAVEEIFTNDPVKFTKNTSTIPVFKLAKEVLGNGLFWSDTDSEDWIIPHHVLKAPFSTGAVRTLLPLMCEQAELLVRSLKREVGVGNTCQIDHWVTKMAFETIAVCATGTSFGSFDYGQDAPFIKALDTIITGVTDLGLSPVPPRLWEFVYRKTLRELRISGKLIRDTCNDVIRKRTSGNTQNLGTKRDIMDMMLNDKDSKTGKIMTEEQIVDQILTFLFAGQDSTAAALGTLLCYLCAHPDKKAKLLDEIDRVIGTGELEWKHLSEMSYLDWCIKEAMRIVPPIDTVVRTANGDQTLRNKWHVEDGAMCLIGIMALHYDKSLWGEDAHEFKPERWEKGAPHKYAYMPFAYGHRRCIGSEFTIIEQKVTIVKLFQHFDFRRPGNVQAEPGYTTLKRETQTMIPFINMDIEFKSSRAFIGLFSAFELLERKR